MQRPRVLFVVVRQELGAIGRDVDVGRALRLARLARQAQVERSLDVLVGPAAANRLALEHLEQHAGTAARAVLFLERDHVAWTHRAVVLLAALPESDAS